MKTSSNPSTPTPLGPHSTAPLGAMPLPAVPPQTPLVKLPFWPKTTSAVTSLLLPGSPGELSPPASGSRYSSVRLLLVSDTNRLPDPSTAIPLGLQRPSALIAG